MQDTKSMLNGGSFPPLKRGQLETLQVNLGYLCNQSCVHCHVAAGPRRKELMSWKTMQQILGFLENSEVKTVDLTGGAPEMHPDFRDFVQQLRAMGMQVIDRCNLTILQEQGYEWLADFLAGQKVQVIASLPCYLEANVDAQRGLGTFEASLAGLRQLNALGYGQPDSGLELHLVYNPQGPSLPPAQQPLEAAYKVQLAERYGISFNRLFTITNMPISRFGSLLLSKGEFAGYMQLLKGAFHPENLKTVMCHSLISIDWQGYLYDCDFNQMLDLPLQLSGKERAHISDLGKAETEGLPITVMDHCYGCTAGQGSSCGGALA